jgi:NAD(P)-dependent dehydrogenase (short-subunit alcohol dehydrogenase family)
MVDALTFKQPTPLSGKRIVVTGAGAGLGRAYAVYAGANGASVVVNDLEAAAAAAVADELIDRRLGGGLGHRREHRGTVRQQLRWD